MEEEYFQFNTNKHRRCSSGTAVVTIRDDPYWNSKKNSLKLIELSSINKVSLV
jgi:hypothetical protein